MNATGLPRRALLGALPALASGASWLPAPAHAGGQVEEPLADAVRSALSSAIAADLAPPEPKFAQTGERLAYLRWLTATSARLPGKVGDWERRRDLLQTIWYEARRAGLDVSLVLGLIQVESGFRKFAVSSAGARGLMQVMPFWSRTIGDGDAGKLFHMQTNLRFGCVILRHYLEREKGGLYMALGRYNGSRGKPQYPNAVFAAQKRWLYQEGAAAAS